MKKEVEWLMGLMDNPSTGRISIEDYLMTRKVVAAIFKSYKKKIQKKHDKELTRRAVEACELKEKIKDLEMIIYVSRPLVL